MNPTRTDWDRTRGFMVRGWELTTWAMVWPTLLKQMQYIHTCRIYKNTSGSFITFLCSTKHREQKEKNRHNRAGSVFCKTAHNSSRVNSYCYKKPPIQIVIKIHSLLPMKQTPPLTITCSFQILCKYFKEYCFGIWSAIFIQLHLKLLSVNCIHGAVPCFNSWQSFSVSSNTDTILSKSISITKPHHNNSPKNSAA
jgi:hypothetical protein